MRKSEETFLEYGMMAVSDCEVIDMLVADGQMSDKLSQIPIEQLAKLSYRELRNMGISHRRAMILVAAFEINRRKTFAYPVTIHSSKDAYDLMSPKLNVLMHEEFWAIYLNRSNRVIKAIMHSKGGISGTVTDVRLILKEAILHSASSLICCHNHPSGNVKPSKADMEITKKIKASGDLMDIKILDHVITTPQNYYSFADEGLI